MHQDGSEQDPQDARGVLPSPHQGQVEPAGYLVLKLKEGDGIQIADDVEIRLACSRNNRADIAIKAPRNKRIRRIPAEEPPTST